MCGEKSECLGLRYRVKVGTSGGFLVLGEMKVAGEWLIYMLKWGCVGVIFQAQEFTSTLK